MSSRAAMTMRATLQRDTARTDQYGQAGPTSWHTMGHVPCYVWNGEGRMSQATPRTIEVDAISMLVPKATDIASGDRVLEVYDRRGQVLYANPLRVLEVIRRRDHLEARLNEYR